MKGLTTKLKRTKKKRMSKTSQNVVAAVVIKK
jgi:hypothetical protein